MQKASKPTIMPLLAEGADMREGTWLKLEEDVRCATAPSPPHFVTLVDIPPYTDNPLCVGSAPRLKYLLLS